MKTLHSKTILKQYADNEPKIVVKLDVLGISDVGYPVYDSYQNDCVEEYLSTTKKITCELVPVCDLAILINPETSKEQLIERLRKIAGELEEDKELEKLLKAAKRKSDLYNNLKEAFNNTSGNDYCSDDLDFFINTFNEMKYLKEEESDGCACYKHHEALESESSKGNVLKAKCEN
jgi:hypothetical protein